MAKLIEIVPGLYTRGLPKVNQVEELWDAGIRDVLNLIPTNDWEFAVKWPGSYANYPMADGKTVDKTMVNFAVNRIVADVKLLKMPVLVHCRAGRNRTGLVVCAALVRLGMTPFGAIEHFRRVRPNGLANPVFERFILDL